MHPYFVQARQLEDRFIAAAWAAQEGSSQLPPRLRRRRACAALALQLLTAYQGALLVPPPLPPPAGPGEDGDWDTFDSQASAPHPLFGTLVDIHPHDLLLIPMTFTHFWKHVSRNWYSLT